MTGTWKTTAVIAVAIVLLVSISEYTRYWTAKSCYEAAAQGAVVECNK